MFLYAPFLHWRKSVAPYWLLSRMQSTKAENQEADKKPLFIRSLRKNFLFRYRPIALRICQHYLLLVVA
ncbi:hypothetical protein CQ062_19595 [Ochrobactrum sp. MYb68]|nr:hypothetical protein CQ062_19595 [Ochrobactrum sp. MYb68]